MDEQQLAQLIESVRKNEERTHSMGEALLQFNESFGKMLDLLEQTSGLEQLQEGSQKVGKLQNTLQRMEENLQINRRYNEQRFDHLEMNLESLAYSLNARVAQSEVCVHLKEQLYMIMPEREQIVLYDMKGNSQQQVQSPEGKIKQLLVYDEQIWIMCENGSLYNTDGEEIIDALDKVVASPSGILGLALDGTLLIYRAGKAYGIDSQVQQFEIVGECYLVYQKQMNAVNETDEQVNVKENKPFIRPLTEIEKSFTSLR